MRAANSTHSQQSHSHSHTHSTRAGLRSSSSCWSLRNIYCLFVFQHYHDCMSMSNNNVEEKSRKKRPKLAHNIVCVRIFSLFRSFLFFSVAFCSFVSHIYLIGAGAMRQNENVARGICVPYVPTLAFHRFKLENSSCSRVSYLSSKTSVYRCSLSDDNNCTCTQHDDNKLLSVANTLIESVAKRARVASANRNTTLWRISLPLHLFLIL